MNKNTIGPKVISIDLTSRGFGYAVLNDETTLIDWGYTSVLFGRKKRTAKKSLEIVEHYLPDCVVLQSYTDIENRKANHVSDINKMIQKGCMDLDVDIRFISQKEVYKTFKSSQAKNKHDIAHAVSEWFPELEWYKPPRRKCYDSERDAINIFDAAAMALSFYDRYGQ